MERLIENLTVAHPQCISHHFLDDKLWHFDSKGLLGLALDNFGACDLLLPPLHGLDNMVDNLLVGHFALAYNFCAQVHLVFIALARHNARY